MPAEDGEAADQRRRRAVILALVGYVDQARMHSQRTQQDDQDDRRHQGYQGCKFRGHGLRKNTAI